MSSLSLMWSIIAAHVQRRPTKLGERQVEYKKYSKDQTAHITSNQHRYDSAVKM